MHTVARRYEHTIRTEAFSVPVKLAHGVAEQIFEKLNMQVAAELSGQKLNIRVQVAIWRVRHLYHRHGFVEHLGYFTFDFRTPDRKFTEHRTA